MAILKIGVDAGGADRSVKLKITKGDDEPREVIVKQNGVEAEDEVDKGEKLTIEVIALYDVVYNKETMGSDTVEMAEEKEASASGPKSAKEESGAASPAYETHSARRTTHK